MNTLLPFNAAAPRSLVLDPPLTDAELEEFCRLNDVARIERTKEGVIRMNPPAGMFTSDGNAEVIRQLRNWWIAHRQGRVCDSNAGFYLPDGSMLSPDAAYLLPETLARMTKADRKGFPHLCPDFIIELHSKSDRLSATKNKMEQWIANGVQLGWLINPYKRQVHVYTTALEPAVLSAVTAVQGQGPVAGFRLDLGEVWSCYEF